LGPWQRWRKPGSETGRPFRLSANGKFWVGVRYTEERVVGGPVPDVVPPLVTSAPTSLGARWLAWFRFGQRPGAARPMRTSWCPHHFPHSRARRAPIAVYAAGAQETDLLSLNTAICCRARATGLPVWAYVPYALQSGRFRWERTGMSLKPTAVDRDARGV